MPPWREFFDQVSLHIEIYIFWSQSIRQILLRRGFFGCRWFCRHNLFRLNRDDFWPIRIRLFHNFLDGSCESWVSTATRSLLTNDFILFHFCRLSSRRSLFLCWILFNLLLFFLDGSLYDVVLASDSLDFRFGEILLQKLSLLLGASILQILSTLKFLLQCLDLLEPILTETLLLLLQSHGLVGFVSRFLALLRTGR